MKRTCCLLLALLAGFFVAGQASSVLAATGAIQVTVYEVKPDKTKDLVIGATAVLSDPSKRFPDQALISNENGQVMFPLVEPGSGYVVIVSMPGYTTIPKKDVRVVAGVTTQLTIQLIPEKVETVNVVAKQRLVELDQEAQGQTKISGEEFQDLPVFGRDYQAALTLAPGVQDSNGDGNPNVHGSRESDFRMTVDGVSNVDPLTGGYLSNINPDSIEEIEIIDSGADASFGGAVGGYGRIITKSGGNKFEGSVNLFFGDSLFTGNGVGATDPVKFSRFQPSIYFSGPIFRDKLWFSVSHELIKIDEPFTVVGGRSFVQTIDSLRSSDKLTWQVTPKNKLQLEWRADPLHIKPYGVDSLTPPSSGYKLSQGGPTTTFKWVAPFSPTFFWESTVGFSNVGVNINPVVDPFNVPAANQNGCVTSPIVGGTAIWGYLSNYRCTDRTPTGGSRVSGPGAVVYNDKRQRWSYQLDAEQFIERWLGGQHRFKMGFGLERARFNRDETIFPRLTLRQNGLIQASPTETGTAAYFLDAAAYYFPGQSAGSVQSGSLLAPQRGVDTSLGNYYNVYFNDNYEPRSNLSVNIGVRLAREELTSDGYQPFDPRVERATYNSAVRAIIEQCVVDRGCGNSQNTECYKGCFDSAITNAQGLLTIHPLDNPGLVGNPNPTCPQAINYGLCLALDATRKTSPFLPDHMLHLRSTETFTIVSNSVAPRVSVSWDPRNDAKTRLSGSWGRYYGDTFLGPLVDENGPDRVVQTYAMDTNKKLTDTNFYSTPRSIFDSAFNIREVDRNLKQQRNDEWSLSLEREIAPETSIKVRYINRKYLAQLQTQDLNHRAITYEEMRNRPVNVYNQVNSDGTRKDCPTVRGFYDCTGAYASDASGGGTPGRNPPQELPDGLPDLVVESPFFSGVYAVGNYNYSKYEAYIVELIRRYFQNWEMDVSYTYSKTLGRAEDYNSSLGSDPTVVDQEVGVLGYDQPHVFKVNGRVFVPKLGGFRLGGAVTFQSGLPYSITETRPVLEFPSDLTAGEAAQILPNVTLPSTTRRFVTQRTIYPTGKRNDQRNAAFWDLSVNAQKEFMIKNVKTSFEVEIFDLLNAAPEQVLGLERLLLGYKNGQPVYTIIRNAERPLGRDFLVAMRFQF